MVKVVSGLGIVLCGSIVAAAIWVGRNANMLFSWSPRDWEHDDRQDREA